MKSFEKFGKTILNVDPEEWSAILHEKKSDGTVYQVQDLDDRFRYAVEIQGKPYYATFYVYPGMREEEEKKAFSQVLHTQSTGWFPAVTVQGHGWQCAYCEAMAQTGVVANFRCPCRK